jgi:hypothetical protein
MLGDIGSGVLLVVLPEVGVLSLRVTKDRRATKWQDGCPGGATKEMT